MRAMRPLSLSGDRITHRTLSVRSLVCYGLAPKSRIKGYRKPKIEVKVDHVTGNSRTRLKVITLKVKVTKLNNSEKNCS